MGGSRRGLSYLIIRYIQLSGMAQEQRGPDNRGSTVKEERACNWETSEFTCGRENVHECPCNRFLNVGKNVADAKYSISGLELCSLRS